MEREDGHAFDCRIPPFSLESKHDNPNEPQILGNWQKQNNFNSDTYYIKKRTFVTENSFNLSNNKESKASLSLQYHHKTCVNI